MEARPIEDAGAFARRSAEGDVRRWLGSPTTITATGRETGGQFGLVEVQENERQTPLHVHRIEDEAFPVPEGDIAFELRSRSIPARPGAVHLGPPGVPRRYTLRPGPARTAVRFTPTGFGERLRATAEPAPERRIPGEDEGLPDLEPRPATIGASAASFRNAPSIGPDLAVRTSEPRVCRQGS